MYAEIGSPASPSALVRPATILRRSVSSAAPTPSLAARGTRPLPSSSSPLHLPLRCPPRQLCGGRRRPPTPTSPVSPPSSSSCHRRFPCPPFPSHFGRVHHPPWRQATHRGVRLSCAGPPLATSAALVGPPAPLGGAHPVPLSFSHAPPSSRRIVAITRQAAVAAMASSAMAGVAAAAEPRVGPHPPAAGGLLCRRQRRRRPPPSLPPLQAFVTPPTGAPAGVWAGRGGTAAGAACRRGGRLSGTASSWVAGAGANLAAGPSLLPARRAVAGGRRVAAAAPRAVLESPRSAPPPLLHPLPHPPPARRRRPPS